MKAVIQRVTKSELGIDNKMYSKIENGLLILLGVTHNDSEIDAKILAEKICKLRIFRDEENKMNLSVKDIGGSLHIVSQFTLYADCSHGNRPGFTESASPEKANELYEKFINYCKLENINVQTGIFGAHMNINLINDGPVTIILECVNGKII